jgi:dihydrofolate reductase
MKIVAIAVIGKNRELGRGNHLIWDLPNDLERFRAVTRHHPVIMGRKTHESIGRVLPSRPNIVVTRNPDYRETGCVVVPTIEKALELAKGLDKEMVYVIGGGEIYKAALPYVTHLDLTLVDAEAPDAEAFFPEYEKNFKEISHSEPTTENGLTYSFVNFERK